MVGLQSRPKGRRNRPCGSKVINAFRPPLQHGLFVERIYVAEIQPEYVPVQPRTLPWLLVTTARLPKSVSTQTLAADMLRFMRTASGARRMIPIVHVKPPRNAGKDASRATAHLRCSSLNYETACLRPALTNSRVSVLNSTPAPAASRVSTPITQKQMLEQVRQPSCTICATFDPRA